MQIKLADKRPEPGGAMTFFFRPAPGMTWQAGQFLTYKLPHSDMDDRKDERYFTIASAPEEARIQLTTRFSDRSSSFKKALKELPLGSGMEVVPPDGDFTVADPTEELVWIAGGVGITPYRAILKHLDAKGLPINVTLLYANRDDDFIFKSELEQLAVKHAGLKLHYFVSPRRIDEAAVRGAAPDLQKPVFYVSGPEPMVEAFEKMLAAMGIPAHHIKTDFFPGYLWP